MAWFVAVVFLELAAPGLASVLPSGTAWRVLMVSTIVNPVGAVRTGTPSLLFWWVAPTALVVRRLRRAGV